MPKYKVAIIVTERAIRYVDAENAEQARAIVEGKEGVPDLSEAEYDYEETCSNEEVRWVMEIEDDQPKS